MAWDPPHHLGYVIVKGFPVRHYRADITFTPEGMGTAPVGMGTLIRWSASFDALIPGTGRLMSVILRAVISRFASGVARYADSQVAAGGAPGSGTI